MAPELRHVAALSLGCAIGDSLPIWIMPGWLPGPMPRLRRLRAGLAPRARPSTLTTRERSWAIAVVEDLKASVEVLFFPKSYEVIGAQLTDGAAIATKGKLDRRDGTPRLVGMELVVLDLEDSAHDRPQEDRATPVVLTLPTAKVTADLIAQLKHTLRVHPGPCPVHIKLRGSRGELVLAINGTTG